MQKLTKEALKKHLLAKQKQVAIQQENNLPKNIGEKAYFIPQIKKTVQTTNLHYDITRPEDTDNPIPFTEQFALD